MRKTKDELLLEKHLADLANVTYSGDIVKFSNFISLSQRELLFDMLKDNYPNCKVIEDISNTINSFSCVLWGGYDDAERVIVCFMPEYFSGSIVDYAPISCIRISPVNAKFSDDLTHRDYLGTVMGLGLDRNQIGDIIIKKEISKGKTVAIAYVFCLSDKKELLLDLTRIKHTSVKCEEIDIDSLTVENEFEDIKGSVAALRLDAILALMIRSSRSKTINLIRDGLVYLNGRLCTENAKKFEEGDVLTVRGYGKFIFSEINGTSKKDRIHVLIKKYK